MKEPTVLVTGGTGAFGRLLIRELLVRPVKIVWLVRAKTQSDAVGRVRSLSANSKLPKQLVVLKSELSDTNLGLSDTQRSGLASTVTHVLHAAASTRFTLSLGEARERNVTTTQNLLDFAQDCRQLERFGYVSTAFVAGRRTGKILEKDFEHNSGFLNTYEQSKYEAEALVRTYSSALPLAIFRPSLVLVARDTRDATPRQALNLGLNLVRRGLLPVLPGNAQDKLDITTGGYASKAVVQILLTDKLRYLSYHVASGDFSPRLEDLIKLIHQESKREVSLQFLGDIDSFNKEVRRVTRFRPDLKLVYKKTESFLPELAFPKVFDRKNLLSELPEGFGDPNPFTELKLQLR